MELDDQIVAVPVGEGSQEFRGVIKLNNSGYEIFELLKNDTTEANIIEILQKRYGYLPEIEGFVNDMITYLKNEGVLA
jgi:hypothetical protein